MRPKASPKGGSDASDCLTDELMVELMEGRLPEEQLARAHRHAAQCNDCRALLATVARGGLAVQGAPPEAKHQSLSDSTFTMERAGPRDSPVPGGVPPASKPWSPPSQFDEFRLIRPIGRGGMGVVYLAQDTSLERLVAVKFIASEQPTPQVRANFETEARAIARLQHPNVVTVFRVGEIEGHAYIVSEYVVGQSLAKLPRPMPWRRALALGLGLARGLAAAHRQGVLHRDIKPTNALVTERGEVKLLDFGLAERFDRSADSLPSGRRIFAGTPRYMAPELLSGGSATPRSDIYSLGLVLHELCTDRLPRAQEELLARLSRRAPAQEPHDAPVPAGLAEGMDPDFAALIHQCLAPNPSERFASAERVCELLEPLEKNNASAPLATGNPYRGLAPFEANHRALFFGRDDDIRALIERLQRQSLVLVAGDSGVGKSSLCRAGVLPRVAAGELDQGRECTTVTLCPGRRPLQSLAAALAPLLHRKEAELFEAFSSTPTGFGQALREAHEGRRALLLFIDQLEELITLAEPEQAERFALLLGELALPSTGVRVLLTVRGDFLTRVCALPGLGEEAERGLYILRPLSAEGVREAIVGPARAQGVVFESDELIQALVSSTAQGAGSLPLLQFALTELWRRHDPVHGRITRTALEEMGGVAGALSRHADGVLARLDPTGLQAARRLLLRLVTAEGTRGEGGERELGTAEDAATSTALRVLVEGRLLHASTAAGEARYQIAHDSLLTSWGTLRNWLDNDIGNRAVRQRIEAASTEWERLSRPREALWGQRQLDEALPLDPSTLGVRERAFLLASSRAARLRRWGRRLAQLMVPLVLAVIYGASRLQKYLDDESFVSARLQEARGTLDEGTTFGKQGRASREEALAWFDGHPPASSSLAGGKDPADSRRIAEQRWSDTLTRLKQAEGAYARATRSLERALERGHAQDEARELLLRVTYERLLLAESFHQQGAQEELRQRLEHLIEDARDGAQWRQRVSAPAELELVTEPPGAKVAIERYVRDAQGVLRREPVSEHGPTPLSPTPLPAGSYHLRVTRPGRAPVDLPLLLTRGGREQLHLVLPEAVPEGYVYIPPGCFLLGSADPEQVRIFMSAAPLHRFCLGEGYLIGRGEVTFQDWLDYLDTLPPGAEARRVLEQPHFSTAGAVTLRQQPGGGWTFSFRRSNDIVLTAREGEPIRYPGREERQTVDWRKLPLTGISAEDLQGYFYWLDQSGRMPGARLCNELEWERAARGADGRTYPHGDRLRPDDVNIDVTYGRESTAFGPDEVGAHPASASPFGLLDMAGNAFELTRPATADLGRIVLRGGAWYYDQFGARVANRTAGDPTQRDVLIGVRVCAPFAPRP
ncbi:bifunctional serine/threonine-protein kinase/formylglycine-generating enzyme family protein [Archangium lipolyticum]|uniref:bifunctional serine/threonine-protein kinase/formylglycine-generating enzyme family protein n=1 Tax=Archangium lipolyticum TaxID=2970465 RepID=UPI002149CA87|nr:bifunctional serine/threonine-protein kinase/formylglycine-generating enzyme family protein [Archangium lipolyticum]